MKEYRGSGRVCVCVGGDCANDKSKLQSICKLWILLDLLYLHVHIYISFHSFLQLNLHTNLSADTSTPLPLPPPLVAALSGHLSPFINHSYVTHAIFHAALLLGVLDTDDEGTVML